MFPMMQPGEVARIAQGGRQAKTPSRATTTLYELIATLQAVVHPHDDALVVATVVYLLVSGRLTFLRETGTSPCESHEMRGRWYTGHAGSQVQLGKLLNNHDISQGVPGEALLVSHDQGGRPGAPVQQDEEAPRAQRHDA
jgi:hypothetical protein